ncbi:DUF5391 family protein [Peribacillus frigoritolerans]|uniref:DUF5391 family protein n=1 Tax=Peribacillus frigoritolerans TaxID=450367 RepID=UPI00345D19A6
MTTKTRKSKIILTTIVSAVLFCSLLVVSSLSDFGPNANEFGDLGMWSSVGTVLVFYLLPLIIYILGVDAMKIVMAIFCGIGLLVIVTIILVMTFMDIFSSSNLIVSVGAIILCIAALISNIVWYFVAFKSPTITHEA